MSLRLALSTGAFVTCLFLCSPGSGVIREWNPGFEASSQERENPPHRGTIQGKVVSSRAGQRPSGHCLVQTLEGEGLAVSSLVASEGDDSALFEFTGVTEGDYLVETRLDRLALVDPARVRVSGPTSGLVFTEVFVEGIFELGFNVVTADTREKCESFLVRYELYGPDHRYPTSNAMWAKSGETAILDVAANAKFIWSVEVPGRAAIFGDWRDVPRSGNPRLITVEAHQGRAARLMLLDGHGPKAVPRPHYQVSDGELLLGVTDDLGLFTLNSFDMPAGLSPEWNGGELCPGWKEMKHTRLTVVVE